MAIIETNTGEDSGAAPGKVTTWADPAEIKPETVTKEQVAAKTRNRRVLWIPIPGTLFLALAFTCQLWTTVLR